MEDLFTIPEENDTIGFVDEDGEPLDYVSRVEKLIASYVNEKGFLVFKIMSTDGVDFFIIKADISEYPHTEWKEVYDS